MAREEGLDLLNGLEKMQQGDMDVNAGELACRGAKFPEVPKDVWKFMKGQ